MQRLFHVTILGAGLIAFLIGFSSERALAQLSDSWIGGTGSWFDGTKWSLDFAPNIGNPVRINNGGTVQILAPNAFGSNLTLGLSALESGTLQVGSTGTLSLASFARVGDAGSGILLIENGGVVTNVDGEVGKVSGATGVVTVQGTGSVWANTGALTVGGAGTGTLTIADGGALQVGSGPGFAGPATINSQSALNIGVGGLAGTLAAGSVVNDGSLAFNHTDASVVSAAISGGGSITKAGVGVTTLSSVAGFNGTVSVSGGQLVLQNGSNADAYTVNAASGTLHFENATVAEGPILGSITANSGTVEYLGSTVTGRYLRGDGTHRVLNGGFSHFNGVTTFTTAKIVQDGTTTFDLFTNGGLLTSNGYSYLTSTTNTASGRIVVNGIVETSEFLNSGELTINNGATLYNYGSKLVNGGGSRTTVNPGGAISLSSGAANQLDLNGALLVNNGTITGTVNVNYGSLAKGAGAYGVVNVFDGGVYSPGNSPGTATVSSLQFDDGSTVGGPKLQIELGGINQGTEYDHIDVTGLLSLGGTLDVSLLPGFNPQSGNTFDILDWDSLDGEFYDVNLPDLSAGLAWNTSQLYTSGVLSVGVGLAGDFDFDGDVDGFDFLTWQRDPSIGSLSDWEANYGTVLPLTLAAASTAVPEPSAILLTLMGSMLAVLLRRH